jgi:hypothetical protein
MSEYPELTAVMNHELCGISVALKMPVRADGALPYLLSEVRQECTAMFEAALKLNTEYGYEPVGDDDTDE